MTNHYSNRRRIQKLTLGHQKVLTLQRPVWILKKKSICQSQINLPLWILTGGPGGYRPQSVCFCCFFIFAKFLQVVAPM